VQGSAVPQLQGVTTEAARRPDVVARVVKVFARSESIRWWIFGVQKEVECARLFRAVKIGL
jgi:hypothetical protein